MNNVTYAHQYTGDTEGVKNFLASKENVGELIDDGSDDKDVVLIRESLSKDVIAIGIGDYILIRGATIGVASEQQINDFIKETEEAKNAKA